MLVDFKLILTLNSFTYTLFLDRHLFTFLQTFYNELSVSEI